jgi:hypothetical protein
VSATAKNSDAARALLAFLIGPEAEAVFKGSGVER